MSGLKSVAVALILALGGACLPAHAQDTPGPSPQALVAVARVPSTEVFVKTAAAANGFEIASSKLALEKSKNPAIRAFAQHMVTDHTRIGEAFVAALAKADTGITPAPGLTPDLDKIMADLSAKSGAAFDAAYLAAQTQGHMDAVGLFGGYAKGGSNAVMRAFATETLPTIKMHLTMCYELATSKAAAR